MGSDREPVEQETPQQREDRVNEEARAEREEQRERRDAAIRFNLDLGLLVVRDELDTASGDSHFYHRACLQPQRTP